jgi:hypothetical protein
VAAIAGIGCIVVCVMGHRIAICAVGIGIVHGLHCMASILAGCAVVMRVCTCWHCPVGIAPRGGVEEAREH